MRSEAFRVTIVGSGTGIPVPERGYAGVLVQLAGESWLLDAGPGSLQRLAQLGVTYQTLDRVMLTHLHPDHSLDLVSILFAMHIPSPARTKPLTIYGPAGLRAFHEGIRVIYPGMLDADSYTLTVEEWSEGARTIGDVQVQALSMHHSIAALGYRLTWQGKSVAYSGDTDLCAAVVKLGRAADLLILECSVTDEMNVAGHLTPSECGRIAAEAQCHKLALTHFYPVFKDYDILARVRRAYDGPVELARDLQSFLL